MPLLLVATLAFALAPPPAPSLAALAAPAGGKVGFAALDLASGRTLGRHQDEAFRPRACSSSPSPSRCCARSMRASSPSGRHHMGRRTPAPAGRPWRCRQEDRGRLLEAMIVASDNTACDKLLSLLGGPAGGRARVRALGVEGDPHPLHRAGSGRPRRGTIRHPRRRGRRWSDVARRQAGLAPARRSSTTLLAGGRPDPSASKPPSHPGRRWPTRPAASDTRNGETDATNDVGLVTFPDGKRIAVAVFVRASPADIATRERVIAELARAAWETFK